MEQDAVILRIRQADAEELEMLMDAVFERKRQLFPDWDIFYIALPKENWDQRQMILRNILEFERRAQE